MMCLCNSQCQGEFIHKHDFIQAFSCLGIEKKRKENHLAFANVGSINVKNKHNVITIIVASS